MRLGFVGSRISVRSESQRHRVLKQRPRPVRRPRDETPDRSRLWPVLYSTVRGKPIPYSCFKGPATG